MPLFEPGEMEALAEQARAQVQEEPPAVEATPTGDPPVDDPPPVTTTSTPSSGFGEATERAMGYETLVSDAKENAASDIRAARMAAGSAGPGDTAIMEGRVAGAKAKGAKAIRAAEKAVTTPLAGGAGESTVPKLTGFGPEIEPPTEVPGTSISGLFKAAARVAAKQKQVEDDSKKVVTKRESKIRELSAIKDRYQGYALRGADKVRAEGLGQEVSELDLQIRNLDNLEHALESIRVKTLGSMPVDPKTVKEEKKKLEGEPAEFDPERSRRAQ